MRFSRITDAMRRQQRMIEHQMTKLVADDELARAGVLDAIGDEDRQLAGQTHELRVCAVERSLDDSQREPAKRSEALCDRVDPDVLWRGNAQTHGIGARRAARVRDPSLPHGGLLFACGWIEQVVQPAKIVVAETLEVAVSELHRAPHRLGQLCDGFEHRVTSHRERGWSDWLRLLCGRI